MVQLVVSGQDGVVSLVDGGSIGRDGSSIGRLGERDAGRSIGLSTGAHETRILRRCPITVVHRGTVRDTPQTKVP